MGNYTPQNAQAFVQSAQHETNTGKIQTKKKRNNTNNSAQHQQSSQ